MLAVVAAAALNAQDLSDIHVEKIVKGIHFGEGPAWSPDGFLLFSDTVTNKLHKFVPGKGDSDFANVPGGPIGNAYDAQGRLYTCEFRERRVTRTSKNGKTEVLASRFESKRFNAPNDIVVRRDGHAYFTDPAFGDQEDHARARFLRSVSSHPQRRGRSRSPDGRRGPTASRFLPTAASCT